MRGLAALGFGHLEVGTVTPMPQPGNPSPRVFRLVEDDAVINRMGFPGNGSAYMARSLRGKQRRIETVPLGAGDRMPKKQPSEQAEPAQRDRAGREHRQE